MPYRLPMNSIDAVEGTAKTLLGVFVNAADEYRLDASEYIRNVKYVIDAVVHFVENNPEVGETPELIRDELYSHAKALWLERLTQTVDSGLEWPVDSDIEYHAYCYDYVYDHGNYPR